MAQTDEYGNPTTGVSSAQVRAAFMKSLGRDFSDPNEGTLWQNDPNYEANIANSAEGQAYKAKQAQPQPQANIYTPPAAAATPTTPAAPAAPAASNRVTSPNGWYVEGTKTYDSNGTLQGDSGFNRAALADALYQLQISGAGDGFNLDSWLAQHPDFASGVKSAKNGEMMVLPDGSAFDVRRSYDPTNNTGSIVSFGANERNAGIGTPTQFAGGGGAGGGGGYSGSISGTINGSTSSSSSDPMNSAVQAAILKQLGTLQNPTDPNSATVKAITDPYHLQSQIGLEGTRRALAEQAYAHGNLNTGGYAGSQIAAVEKAGADEANFTGQTVATQEAQRQAMLMNILGLGNNVNQFSQQLSATQKNFADQLAQNDRQFGASLKNAIAQFGQTQGYQYALLDWSKTQRALDGSTTPVTGV